MKAQTKETQSQYTPHSALAALKEGNQRFLNTKQANRDLLGQVKDTAGGQYPFAVVLSCIDSRVPVELVFDQGIGDIFSARVAGNIVNEDLLGSIEYGCKVAGSKAVVVLGHTGCGAVKGACDDVQLGNITPLLAKIKPSVEAVKTPEEADLRKSSNPSFVNDVVYKNVELTMVNMRNDSPLLRDMENDGDITIVGAVYDVASGKVEFLS
ncbi:MAG TPA: carbonic anhydrase [Flavobacteriaceae bacterium]|nr:carbonic anhydrase [Flavobacteriaceae bacterium]MAY52059.1 carbonic anhydrase [Flavobacteriaceae bacterium]HBR55009.1 carbonic anhydrase [Flavobacteriaceae bacterium]HIB47590.1 carbonic anhydrase [Flavobacteriaceae bacterium]HIN98894.1 carbonic anhydrase [Flavobacteriaceae bacterium]|tara:strand:- start:24602 stop:25231 length:630 start_codon:yes stop_codon:yes gene_type:complete